MSGEVEALQLEQIDGQLRAVLLLLTGNTDAAIKLLDEPAGAGPARGPGRVLVPYLLAAGCAGPTRPQWRSARVAKLLGGVDTPGAWDWTTVGQHASESTSVEGVKPLSVLLTEQLAGITG